MNVAMDYREQPPPPGYDGLVKAVWTLDAAGSDTDWISRAATPDGCLEIIFRSRGRSRWNGEQPDCFLGGLIDQPARLEMRGDARFTGIRLWPWAAPMFGLPPAHASLNRWLALETADWLSVRGLEGALAVVAQAVPDPALAAMGRVIATSSDVRTMAQRLGMSHRRLQRWFSHHVGVPPQRYIRLMRFQAALASLQTGTTGLADQAVDGGYADQPHMAREFRAMAGAPPVAVRRLAQGPFV